MPMHGLERVVMSEEEEPLPPENLGIVFWYHVTLELVVRLNLILRCICVKIIKVHVMSYLPYSQGQDIHPFYKVTERWQHHLKRICGRYVYPELGRQ